MPGSNTGQVSGQAPEVTGGSDSNGCPWFPRTTPATVMTTRVPATAGRKRINFLMRK